MVVAADPTFDAAWAAHRIPLFRHLLGLTRDAAAAEDLTQEAFLRLIREMGAGRSPDNPGAWLFRVGRNLATSRGRRTKVAERAEPVLVADEARRSDAPSPEAAVVAREEHRALRTALARLRPVEREVLLLAAEGRRGPEIAERLGRSRLATRTLLCRARMRLRAELAAVAKE